MNYQEKFIRLIKNNPIDGLNSHEVTELKKAARLQFHMELGIISKAPPSDEREVEVLERYANYRTSDSSPADPLLEFASNHISRNFNVSGIAIYTIGEIRK